MRNFLLILTGSTALLSLPALAQGPQTGTPAAGAPSPPAAATTASLADCDRLETFLEQRRPSNTEVTVEQVRRYRTSNNAQACHDALVRLDPNAAQATNQGGKEGAASNIIVQEAAPALRVEQAPPQVTVQQQPPQVTVRQAQPDITIRQPAPTVTIDIPQPEVIVKMPKPEINVAQAQPQVQVNQPPPRVQVTQPPQQPQVQVQAGQPEVNVQQSRAAPNVQVQENNTQPTVHYESAQPKVVINQPKGGPQVRFEQADTNQQDRAQQNAASDADRQRLTSANRQPSATTGTVAPGPAAATAGQPLTVSRIKNMTVYDARGTKVGDVERIVQAQNGKEELIVGVGGFLGLGERHVAIPTENVAVRGDRLLLEGLTEDQLNRMPPVDRNSRDLRDVDGNATIELSSR
jgi:sporulation protein YlmC with PRC-barrel domain